MTTKRRNKHLNAFEELMITTNPDELHFGMKIEHEGENVTINIWCETPGVVVGVSDPETCISCEKPILCSGERVQISIARRPQ